MSGILKIRQAMKKKYLIAAALLAVCGCQKSNESPVVTGKADKIQAYVEDNADTKTIATPSKDGKSLDFVWDKGDKIGVVTASTDVNDWGYEVGTNKYTSFEYTLDGEGGSKVGTFSTENGTPDGAKYLAIYPREATSGVTRENAINICYTIPIDQVYVENGFNTKYAVMYAESDSKENMTFKHYSSVLKLKMTATGKEYEGTKVTGIKVTATPEDTKAMPSICGNSYFNKSKDGTTINHYNAWMSGGYNENKVINYSVPSVALSSKEVEFNIVFNPVPNGKDDKANNVVFTFEIQTDRGSITKKTKTLQVHRGVVYNMPAFDVKLAPQDVYFFDDKEISAPNLSSPVKGTENFTSLTIKPNEVTGKITLAETDLATISDYIEKYGSEAGVKLDLSKAYYTSNVWPNTFRNNVKLQSISLPLNITKGSKNGDLGDGSAPFMGCTKLSEIILDEAMVSLPDMFLNGVPSIKTINLTKYVRDIYWLQNDSDANLENIKVDENNTNLYADKGVLYRRYNDKKTNKIVKSLQYIPVANTAALTKDGEDYIYTLPSDVLYICQAAFHCNKNITKIVVTNSFESIVGGYVFGTKKLKVMDFSALDHVPTINVNATLSLGPKGGEIWCASDDMITKFKSDEKWAKVADEARWTFKVKPAVTKSQAPAISNLNSSKPVFSWE